MNTTHHQQVLASLNATAQKAGVFASITLDGSRLECEALDAGAPAQYRVEIASDGWAISLGTMDRWLSESIEGQLVDSRDSMEALLSEELNDLEWTDAPPKIRHFRDDARRYVFECTVAFGRDESDDLRRTSCFLLAFQAMFLQLGNMSGEQSEE